MMKNRLIFFFFFGIIDIFTPLKRNRNVLFCNIRDITALNVDYKYFFKKGLEPNVVF